MQIILDEDCKRQISKDECGHSYQKIFARVFEEKNSSPTCVEIDDPYIKKDHQVLSYANFFQF